MQPRMQNISDLVLILGVFSLVMIHSRKGLASGLRCWLCIGDDCDKDPYLVETAMPRDCKDGQSCMKVYYIVKAAKTNQMITATTRTCSAGKCNERDDLANCTTDDVENPGCTRHYCCNDQDMCNRASPTLHGSFSTFGFVILDKYFLLIQILLAVFIYLNG